MTLQNWQFVVTTIAGFLIMAAGFLGYLGTPPVLALGDPLRLLLIIGGAAVLGVPLSVGYAQNKVAASYKKPPK